MNLEFKVLCSPAGLMSWSYGQHLSVPFSPPHQNKTGWSKESQPDPKIRIMAPFQHGRPIHFQMNPAGLVTMGYFL